MAMEIKNHVLHGQDLSFKETPNIGGAFANSYPNTIVIHYTASGNLNSAVQTLTNQKVKASAHLIVGRNGNIVQLAPFDTITWHAGRSTWKDMRGLNKFSIGIEVENAGLLKPNSDGSYESWFGRRYEASDVIEAVHRNESRPAYWHKYTAAQLRVVKEICQLLVSAYPIKHIVGHEEISPGRKQDPGPAFPLDELRTEVLGGTSENNDTPTDGNYLVTVHDLNIRSGPGLEFDLVSTPLKKESRVTKIEESNQWVKVETTITGWVHSKYLIEEGKSKENPI